MRLRHIPGAEEAIEQSPYVIQEPKEMKGKWDSVFENRNPIHIEVGMGKGRFIMELAQRNPQINYIGIERYSTVLLKALQKREQLPVSNICFMCIDAKELGEIFEKGEVEKIYLNFSDPWPKDRHAKRRLTSPSLWLSMIRCWLRTETWSLRRTTGGCSTIPWNRFLRPDGR